MDIDKVIEQCRKTIDGLTEIRGKIDPDSTQAEQLRWWIGAKQMELDDLLEKKKEQE